MINICGQMKGGHRCEMVGYGHSQYAGQEVVYN